VLEEIVPNPLTTTAVTSIRATTASAAEGQDHPVLPLAQVTSQQPVTATSSPMTDVPVELKDTDLVTEQQPPPPLSLPLLTSALSPQEKTSQPNSDTSSVTSPTVSDLTSLAKVIRAHPDVIHQAAGSPVKSGSDISSESKEDSADRTTVTGEEMERAAAASGLVTGHAAADNASGYATPASIHSVTGPNAALLPPYVSSVAIDNKIEQAMDLVKSHLMFAVREEVDVLKEKIVGLLERIQALETENAILKQSHENTNNQNNPLSANTNTGSSGGSDDPADSPPQPVNPDSAQELASLVSEVALTSPTGSDVAAAAASDSGSDPVPESAVSPEEEK
jgi:hypothetical protein